MLVAAAQSGTQNSASERRRLPIDFDVCRLSAAQSVYATRLG